MLLVQFGSPEVRSLNYIRPGPVKARSYGCLGVRAGVAGDEGSHHGDCPIRRWARIAREDVRLAVEDLQVDISLPFDHWPP